MKSQTRILIDKYIAINGYERGLKELAERTGIKYLRLQEHIKDPGQFRLFELREIFSELGFSDEDRLEFLKGI